MENQKSFNYLDKVDFAATVCDKDGIVVYQNERAIKRDGGVLGKSLYDCHKPESGRMIRHMIETGSTNDYQIIRHGKHRLLHQTPWYTADGELGGLIELSIDMPDGMPVYDRDKKQQ